MDYTDLTPGTAFMYEGTPYIVVAGEFHRMQMRKAVMRMTMRNLMTGQIVPKTFTASDTFEPAPVEKLDVHYMYHDADTYYFMDKDTYEQYHATTETLGEKTKYLKEECDVTLLVYNNNPIQLVLPKNVQMKVIESPMAIRGDSVTNSFKTVTCENDIKVSVPLFIREGDIIKINTDSGEYIERVT